MRFLIGIGAFFALLLFAVSRPVHYSRAGDLGTVVSVQYFPGGLLSGDRTIIETTQRVIVLSGICTTRRGVTVWRVRCEGVNCPTGALVGIDGHVYSVEQ